MPSTYIDELAERAAKIPADEWKQSNELSCQLAEKPTALDDLKTAIAQRPALQAHLAWRTAYTPSKWLLENELEVIKQRREKVNVTVPVEVNGDAHERAAKSRLTGICFSGGGIRSATFNLGVLQGLAELKVLQCFDYLSSVSGGGYIHQWLAGWIKRQSEYKVDAAKAKNLPPDKIKEAQVEGFKEVKDKLTPLPEKDSPHSHPEPIRWLRRYSNYLTPEKGLFTADTWVVVATWLRNTLLNQIILISGLLFLVLLPHILTFHSLQPKRGWAAAIAIGIIFYLFLTAAFFLGKNLYKFGNHPATDLGLLGQKGVQLGIVIPLLASSLCFTFLFPITSATHFAARLAVCFVVSMALLFALALTIIFWGGAPLCYLQSHHRTAHYQSLGEFWGKSKSKARVRIFLVILGQLVAAIIVSLLGAAWIVLTDLWIAKLWAQSGHYWWRLVLLLDPPLVLVGLILSAVILIGLLGRTFDDGRREWIARLGAWIGLYSLGWIIAMAFSLFGYAAIQWFGAHFKTMVGAVGTWAGTSLGGLLAGKSSKTGGAKDNTAPSSWNPLEILAIVGPYVFITGLLLVLAALGEVLLRGAHASGWFAVFLVFVVPLIVCFLFAWRVDINEFSMHAFYRNRLARCYLGATNASRDPNPFSGFDERDANIAVSQLQPESGYYGPYPIFCTTLNLTFGEDLAWQERKAASFAFTPLFSGYDVGWTAAKGSIANLRYNGFVNTATYAYPPLGIHVATAAAISGAALSPNWGYHSNPATAFLLTIFNVRLGWWLRNPRSVDENGRRLGLGKDASDSEDNFRGAYPSPSPRSSLGYLINELLGRTNDTRKFVYLTDGGHFENMGLYELVRRRCRYIVVCDAEDDGSLQFEGIGMAIRKCRIDFGAEISLDLRPLQHIGDTPYSIAHCVVGTIRYPEDQGKKERDLGVVVYIKSSLTGDEPGDVLNYKKEHPAFPHDTTLNQWFTESQFESYRRLGHHVAVSTFEPARPDSNDCKESTAKRDDYFFTLRGIWYARTPEMDLHSAEHSRRYEALLRRIRKDDKLPGFFAKLFTPADTPSNDPKWKWKTNRTPAEIEHAQAVSSDLIEFIFLVYMELNLVFPEKRSHPFSRGWYQVFKSWGKIDVVQDGWKIFSHGYSRSFRLFAQKELEFPET